MDVICTQTFILAVQNTTCVNKSAFTFAVFTTVNTSNHSSPYSGLERTLGQNQSEVKNHWRRYAKSGRRSPPNLELQVKDVRTSAPPVSPATAVRCITHMNMWGNTKTSHNQSTWENILIWPKVLVTIISPNSPNGNSNYYCDKGVSLPLRFSPCIQI